MSISKSILWLLGEKRQGERILTRASKMCYNASDEATEAYGTL